MRVVLKVVVLSRQEQKDLASVPRHVALKLQLKGALKGLRSIRLSKGYRAYYKVVKDTVEFVRVEGVDKHVY